MPVLHVLPKSGAHPFAIVLMLVSIENCFNIIIKIVNKIIFVAQAHLCRIFGGCESFVQVRVTVWGAGLAGPVVYQCSP